MALNSNVIIGVGFLALLSFIPILVAFILLLWSRVKNLKRDLNKCISKKAELLSKLVERELNKSRDSR